MLEIVQHAYMYFCSLCECLRWSHGVPKAIQPGVEPGCLCSALNRITSNPHKDGHMISKLGG